MDETAALKTKIAALEAQVCGTAIEAAVDVAGIAAPFRRSVIALLRSSLKLEIIDGEPLANGLPVAEAVQLWAKSDAGRPFTAAHSACGTPARVPAGKRRSEMKPAEKGAYIAQHGLAAYEALPS